MELKNSDAGNYKRTLVYETKLDLLENRKDRIITRQGSIIFDSSQIDMTLNCAGSIINLSYLSSYPIQFQMNPFHITGNFRSELSWKPIMLHGKVNGNVRIGETNQFIFQNDNGYADQVESSFLPFALPVYELYWGRLHADELDLTFSIVNEPSKGKIRSKIYVIWKGNLIEFDSAKLVIHEKETNTSISIVYPEKYTITAENSGNNITLEIYSRFEAVASDFIGDMNRYGKITIQILKLLTKSPKGLKSVAKANIRISNSLEMKSYDNLTLIDEYVCFAKI